MKRIGFTAHPVKKGFDDPHDKIDEVLNRNKKPVDSDVPVGKSEQLKKIFDNLQFQNKVRDNPISDVYEYEVFGFETVNLNKFLNMRVFPRSIYVTDKLLRLVASAKYEMLKKWLSKKRSVPMNMIWIILAMVAVIVVVLVVLFLLPSIGVM